MARYRQGGHGITRRDVCGTRREEAHQFAVKVDARERVAQTCCLGLRLFLARMRRKHGLAICAWVFLPDHCHAIICPPHPLTISTVFKQVARTAASAVRVLSRYDVSDYCSVAPRQSCGVLFFWTDISSSPRDCFLGV